MLARSTMKRKRFTGEQIISISRERETGIAVPDLDLDKQMLEDVIKHQKTLSQSCAPMVPMAQCFSRLGIGERFRLHWRRRGGAA